MPFYLKEVDVVPEVVKFKSALIVLCRFCPAASLAVRKHTPYLELFRTFLKTEPFEQLVDNMQSRLVKEGVKTSVFKGNLLNYLIYYTASPLLYTIYLININTILTVILRLRK